MRKILIITTFALIAFNSCSKQIDDNISLKNDSTLSINTDFKHKILDGYFVTAIAFDNLGNTWVGTFKQGLIKYNSKETVVYNSSNSIISDSLVINDIAVDCKNNIWIGSNGLIKYDGNKFTLYNSKNTTIPEDYVRSIAIDSKDNIWFTSSRFRLGGVVKYDGTNWTVYKHDNSDLPLNSVRSIAIDKNDNVWIALSEIVNDVYLVKISNNSWSIYTSKDLGFSPYYFGNIQLDSKNQLYGSLDYSLSNTIDNKRPKMFVFNGHSAMPLHYDEAFDLNFITVDNEDNIWGASCYGRYVVFDGKNWIKDDLSFKDVGVFAIEQAKDNKIWIGTGNGIYINN